MLRAFAAAIAAGLARPGNKTLTAENDPTHARTIVPFPAGRQQHDSPPFSGRIRPILGRAAQTTAE